MTKKITAKCPYCLSKNIKKHGTQKKKLHTIQRYFCKDCQKTFNLQHQSNNKTYPITTILNAISFYNLGHSQAKIIKLISRKFKQKPSQKTISNWLNEYKNICTYNKLRKESKKLYPAEEIIEQHTLMHNNLPYKFQLHKAKLYLLFHNKLYNNQFHNTSRFYEPLKNYLEKIPKKEFPHHIFHPKRDAEELSRSSQLKFETLTFVKLTKKNFANVLASLGLQLAKSNKQRHEAVQNFMLMNDSTTIATEVPVYLTNDDIKYFQNKGFKLNLENYKTPITGHIDLLQIRNGLIHILDYKPDADKADAVNQLTIYALALASRTKLALSNFKAAWFDENNYYEFFPLHAVYEKNN
jgi:transposase-like protein